MDSGYGSYGSLPGRKRSSVPRLGRGLLDRQQPSCKLVHRRIEGCHAVPGSVPLAPMPWHQDGNTPSSDGPHRLPAPRVHGHAPIAWAGALSRTLEIPAIAARQANLPPFGIVCPQMEPRPRSRPAEPAHPLVGGDKCPRSSAMRPRRQVEAACYVRWHWRYGARKCCSSYSHTQGHGEGTSHPAGFPTAMRSTPPDNTRPPGF